MTLAAARRLFAASQEEPEAPPVWADGQGCVRALVLGVTAPARWSSLAAVWRGVQDEGGAPAPAIAVSGDDALQLWFALARPVPAAAAAALLDGLVARYLADLPSHRIRRFPGPGGSLESPPCWPGTAAGPERWAAFVAPDLVPLFEETPWLELPPGDEAQSALLVGLRPVEPDRLAALAVPPGSGPVPPRAEPQPGAVPVMPDDPRQFLRSVMTDPLAPLALRVEAAKALLADGRAGPPG